MRYCTPEYTVKNSNRTKGVNFIYTAGMSVQKVERGGGSVLRSKAMATHRTHLNKHDDLFQNQQSHKGEKHNLLSGSEPFRSYSRMLCQSLAESRRD